MNSVRLRRLKSDYEAIRRLVRLHPKIEIEGVSGNPPNRYIFTLHVNSLREQGTAVAPQNQHRLEVKLPLGYPRDAPLCRMLTPVFHPNIAPHAVCIGDHWSAAESLDLMIQRVGEMLAYQSYNVKSPLNGRAAQWVEENPQRLPTDRAEFFVDLAAVPMPSEAHTHECANCHAAGVPLQECAGAGHSLCGDCRMFCPMCGRMLCLACGESTCPDCTVACGNCRALTSTPAECANGHKLCGDCTIPCRTCGRIICLACNETRCPACTMPCSNCGTVAPNLVECSRGHKLCNNCALVCPNCSRFLCFACNDVPCQTCAAG